MAGLNDNRTDLYDARGNHVGVGGPGMVTQAAADPSGGAHRQVVQTGIQKMGNDVAASQNGVTDVQSAKSVLSGWSYAKRGAVQSAQVQPASVGSAAKVPALRELRERQRAKIDAENAAKASEAAKHEDADEALPPGVRPKVNEGQLQAERNTYPGSIENGANGGQSYTVTVPPTPEVKSESSSDTTKKNVSEADYTAALDRLDEARKKGGIGDASDKLTVFDYEHPERDLPKMPALEDFTESQPPQLKDIDESYRNAYAIMQRRIKAAGDDPESKAKRAKARRAQTLVAALGDLLQAAAGMWGAAKGASSAKLSSISAGLAKGYAREDAAELKREAQRAKDLEQMVRRGEKLTEAENKRLMELWKAGENARKYNISEKNKAILAKYSADLQQVKQYNAQIGRDRHEVQVQHAREVNDRNRHNYRITEKKVGGAIQRANRTHSANESIRVKKADE